MTEHQIARLLRCGGARTDILFVSSCTEISAQRLGPCRARSVGIVPQWISTICRVIAKPTMPPDSEVVKGWKTSGRADAVPVSEIRATPSLAAPALKSRLPLRMAVRGLRKRWTNPLSQFFIGLVAPQGGGDAVVTEYRRAKRAALR